MRPRLRIEAPAHRHRRPPLDINDAVTHLDFDAFFASTLEEYLLDSELALELGAAALERSLPVPADFSLRWLRHALTGLMLRRAGSSGSVDVFGRLCGQRDEKC